MLPTKKIEHIAKSMHKRLAQAYVNDFKPEQYLVTKENIEGIVTFLCDADPTTNKSYLQWIANMYCEQLFKFEDLPRIKQDLTKFNAIRKSLPIEKRNILTYKSLTDLYTVINCDVESKRKRKLRIKKQGTEIVFRNKEYAILRILTHDAACYYGKHTKWCTAAKDKPEDFERYNKDGPLYVLVDFQTDTKYQMHMESKSFMDVLDVRVNISHLSNKYPELKSLIENDWAIKSIKNAEFFAINGITTPASEALLYSDFLPAYRVEEATRNVASDRLIKLVKEQIKVPNNELALTNAVLLSRTLCPEFMPEIYEALKANPICEDGLVEYICNVNAPFNEFNFNTILHSCTPFMGRAMEYLKNNEHLLDKQIIENVILNKDSIKIKETIERLPHAYNTAWPRLATAYAKFFLQDRWEAAEPIIAESGYYMYQYLTFLEQILIELPENLKEIKQTLISDMGTKTNAGMEVFTVKYNTGVWSSITSGTGNSSYYYGNVTVSTPSTLVVNIQLA
jgi:hypothetical protein